MKEFVKQLLRRMPKTRFFDSIYHVAFFVVAHRRMPCRTSGLFNDYLFFLKTGEGFVPVVSTDCPSGPREILEDGKYGRLVPVGDADALARAMLESLQLQHDHVALKARAQDFAVGTVADEYLDLLLPVWRQAPAQVEGPP